MKIYLARHGQAKWQVEPSDDLDTPLTEIGHEQSRRMAKWIAGCGHFDNKTQMHVKILLVSPLRRAVQTGTYLANELGMPLVTQDSLAEAKFHVADYLARTAEPFGNSGPYQVPEIYGEFKARAQDALRELVEQAKCNQGAVLAITHGALIETMLRLIVANDCIRFKPYNAALTLIEWDCGLWHIVCHNVRDYLPVDLRTG